MTTKPEKPPPKIVVLSYRGPVIPEEISGTTRFRQGEGGLVSALLPVMEARSGLWIAAGETPSGIPPGTPFVVPDRNRVQVLHVPIPPSLHDRHYLGFSNRTLWPLAHMVPTPIRFRRRDLLAFKRVNEILAQAAAAHSRPGDLVWVHDYHLALLPGLLRKLAPDRGISFFWHIPFPPYDVLRALPFHEELVTGMLGADTLRFHVPQYAASFRDAAARIVGVPDRDQDGRRVDVGVRPIGIDTRAWELLGDDPAVGKEAALLRREWRVEKVVLGVDRLDYTKGILERIQAVERLLERHPSQRGKFALVQVAVPSRTRVPEYRALRREIDETVGRVNGRFSQGAYLPVRYYYRSLPRRTLAAFYRAADVGLVTPLRDGMNLVCMEFLMVNRDRAPVLILSEFAGAREFLNRALAVNPHDLTGVADALRTALVMPERERRRRFEQLVDQVRGLDVHAWAEGILGELGKEATVSPMGMSDPEPLHSLLEVPR